MRLRTNIALSPRDTSQKSKGSYAFYQYMIETTYADTGRVGVIMPHGVLFRKQ